MRPAPPLADMVEHHQRRQQQRRRVGEVQPGDVGRAAVHRLEDRAVGPMLAPGHDPEPSDQARAQVRHDVAVQVRQQQHVEPSPGNITSCMHTASTIRSS
jgi:hypothetical protein